MQQDEDGHTKQQAGQQGSEDSAPQKSSPQKSSAQRPEPDRHVTSSGERPEAASDDVDEIPPDKVKTISLLDLMQEGEDEESDRLTEGESEQSSIPTVPKPLVSDRLKPVVDDQATPTGAPIPTKLPESDIPPIPLVPSYFDPRERPTVEDLGATSVQPRSAIPGSTQIQKPVPGDEETIAPNADVVKDPITPARGTYTPVSEAPTLPPQPIVPKPEYIQPKPIPRRDLPSRRQPVRAARPIAVVAAAVDPAKPADTVVPTGPVTSPRRGASCLGRIFLVAVLIGLIGLALSVASASGGYIVIASQLPQPSELRSRASTFETARIYDRDGGILYSLTDPNMGDRTFVSLDEIDTDLQQATIATEDERFYTNPGFDPLAIGRAIIQAAQEGEVVSGASTITQQLARALLLDEDERTQRTFNRKVKEIILAAELFRTYPKDEILELYLNEIYYGNRAYGIEAAAQTYFNKSAADLTLAEASLLAGLPQAPALWDPFTAPEKALGRQRQVLGLMISQDYITPAEAQEAIDQSALIVRNMEPPNVTLRHPHFTATVMQQLEAAFGAQAIYQGGLRIYTTIDPAVQRLAEQSIEARREEINAAGANNASIVVVDPRTGEILALVGSLDFNDEEISGQVNMITSPRQPGSAIKPLVYLSAMEEGWTPSTLIWDTQTEFPDGANPPYIPKNYDDEFHGPVLLRPALGNSYNIPAVKALEFFGVCEFIANVQKLGLVSLQDAGCDEVGLPRDHGLSLALGGGEVTPLEMAGAYGVLANQGHYLPPFTISRIENRKGELLFEQQASLTNDNLVARPDHTYLISDILSDDSARWQEFGTNSRLNVEGQRVAAKTGTSGTDRFDVRDGWTVGYTPEVVTAVWVGNTDNEPVGEGQTGYGMASPIWNDFMTRYLSGKQALEFPRLDTITDVEICLDSGAQPGPGCDSRSKEFFAHDQLPSGSDRDFLKPVFIDLWTNLEANENCSESVYEANFFNLVAYGREDVLVREQRSARQWLENTSSGQNWAGQRRITLPLQLPPASACDQDTPRPKVEISQPRQSEQVTGEIEIWGSALGPAFAGYEVEYGLSHDPQGWGRIQERRTHIVDNNLLAKWDASDVAGGPATIRVIIIGPDNIYTEEDDPVRMEARVLLLILEPTATPTSTPTDTPTPTNTPTPTPTPTATTTSTPSPMATSTPSPTPSKIVPSDFTPIPTVGGTQPPPSTATATASL